MPDRLLGLGELRALLLERGCPSATRDAVWAELVGRARSAGPRWSVACAGMALPALIRVCRGLTDRFAGDRADIHAAVVAGFFQGLARVDLSRRAVLVSLRWSAYRAGMAAVRDALDAPTPITGTVLETDREAPVSGHPDLVLARAVADGVITAAEAALIGSTRLEGVRLADAARARAQSYPAANTARHRAERRLLAYLTAPDDAPTDRAHSAGRARPAGPNRRPAPPGRPHRPAGAARPTARRRERNRARRCSHTVTAPVVRRPQAAGPVLGRSGDPMAATPVAAGVPPRPELTHHIDPDATSPLAPPRRVALSLPESTRRNSGHGRGDNGGDRDRAAPEG
ncbi:MAG: hypothetical protein L0I76_37260 [Pseudonocardia sp.]|nr:hypothetical protein [Pseudonocardia sp.]